MGTGDESTAARRLRLLQREFTQPERRGRAERGSAPVHPSTPLNIRVYDYIGAKVAEVEEHTKAEAPDAGPLPADVSRIYDWARASTPDLDPGRLTVREAMIYRQGLEHAIEMGDVKVVRPHPCPKCRCYGLLWQSARQRAVCVNRHCTDANGLAHAWDLARLAREHVAAKNMLKSSAT